MSLWIPTAVSSSVTAPQQRGVKSGGTTGSADGGNNTSFAQALLSGVHQWLPSPFEETEPLEDYEGSECTLDGDANSLCFRVMESWLDIHQFFLEAQQSVLAEEEAALAAEIPVIRSKFNQIHRALMLEKPQIKVRVHRQLPHSETPSLDSSRSEKVRRTDCQVVYNDSLSILLPPCYQYLFGSETSLRSNAADSPRKTEQTGSEEVESGKEELHAGDSESSLASEGGVLPSSIGDTFLILLCQYAKHNHPKGSRLVILEFLARLLYEADFPVSRMPEGGAAALSVLQLSPFHFVVPLLDMIRQISAALDPGDRRKLHPRSYPGNSGSGEVSVGPNDAERGAFVVLLCVLAEKMERIPELANFFVITSAKNSSEFYSSSGDNRPSAESTATQPPTGKEGGQPYFVLLHSLLPYLAHDSCSPEWNHRRDTCRFALSAVLSLAKCPDPWVSDMVGAERAVLETTLAAAATTLLTLCKVPENEDSRTEMLFLTDVVRFWSSITLTAPVVSHALQLIKDVETQFIQGSVLPLLRSSDSQVYSSVCLVLASLLRNVGSTAVSQVMRRVVESILSNEVPADSKSSSHMSVFEQHMLPRLTPNPAFLSLEDQQNMKTFGFRLTRWTGGEATLVLLDAMTTCCPHLFCKHVLSLDMRTKELPSSHPYPPPPSINIQDYFPVLLQPKKRKGSSSPSRRSNSQRESEMDAEEAVLRNEILAKLLLLESNTSAETIVQRDALYYPLSSPVKDKSKSQSKSCIAQEHSPVFLRFPTTEMSVNVDSSSWFHQGVHQSRLVESLVNMLLCYHSLPTTIRVMLTGILLNLCLQPDYRVLYTLLDPSKGRLRSALLQLSQHLDVELQAEVDRAVSPASSSRPSHSKQSTSSWLWKAVSSNFWESSSSSRTGSSSKRGTSQEDHLTGPAALTRVALFQLYTRLTTPIDFSDPKRPQGMPKEVFTALLNQRTFLEMGMSLDCFRQELDITVNYVEISRKLMSLSVEPLLL